jgi:predicted PurR-regulated permease PerM
MGLDFPILLGLIGFLLNYVPTIGSVLAAVPAVLLALLQQETLGLAVIVAIGYVVINVIFGNLIEPYWLGRRLGLSTLVVILSLMFWAWAWGPVGALLAVPLTMVVKIMLENTRDLRWLGVLLDKDPPPRPVVGPAAIDQDEGV